MEATQETNRAITPSLSLDVTNPPDPPKTKLQDVLWHLYQENRIEARHFDDQRAKASNIILLAAVGLTARIGNLEREDWALCLCIMLIGLCGAVFTTAYAKLARLFMARAKTCLFALDVFLSGNGDLESPQIGIRELLKNAKVGSGQVAAESSKLIRNDLLPRLWPLMITLIAGLFMIYIRWL